MDWGRGSPRIRRLLAGAVLSVVAPACGPPPVESVHALRAFQREKVTPTLVKQHLDDLSGTLALIRRLLRETPYEPGASWTQGLALSEATAGQATSLIMSEHPTAELPTTLAVYSRHVTSVLTRTRASVDQSQAQVAAAAASYPSMLDALARVDPALERLRRDFDATEELARLVRDAKAAEAAARSFRGSQRAVKNRQRAESKLESFERQRKEQAPAPLSSDAARLVVKDAVSVTSVALRLAREAAALASMLMLEIPRLASLPAREYARHADSTAQLIVHGPEQVKQIRADLEVDLRALEQLVEALARLEALDVERLPGFAYREGLVDEIVGFTSDLLHFQAKGGGELHFFQPLSLEGGRDYTGRQNEVAYDIEPIVLASANLEAGFDLSRLPQAGGLKLGYATNRVYQSGGTIENRSLAEELGATGLFSDALEAALLYSGWQSSVRLAHFTSGTVDVLQSADGAVVTSAPLAFTVREIAFAREFAAYGNPYQKSLIAKLSYFDYSLPRIMYEFQDATPDAEAPTWTYGRESPVQRVRTELWTTGGISQFAVPVMAPLDVTIGVNVSFGAGRQRFYFLDEQGNRQDRKPFTVAMSGLLRLGLHWRIFHAGRFHADLEADYQAQYLNSSLGTSFGLDGAVLLGSHSLMHGPQGRFSASF